MRTETFVLCSYSNRRVVAGLELAETWARIKTHATSSKPDFHAIGAFMSVRDLLSKPNTFDTQSRVDNMRIRAKIERGYELYYTMLEDGDIYLNDIKVDMDGSDFEQESQGEFLYKVDAKGVEDDGTPKIGITPITANKLTLDPAKVNHIFLADSGITSRQLAAQYAIEIINTGYADHKISQGKSFYFAYRKPQKMLSGFSFHNKPSPESKFIKELSSVVVGAAKISSSEYLRRSNKADRIRQVDINDDTKKRFGNVSQNSLDSILRDKDLSKSEKEIALQQKTNKKFGLPDPVVCWSTTGNADKLFKKSIDFVSKNSKISDYSAIYHNQPSSSTTSNSHRLQQVYLNNCSINVNSLDHSMSKLGIEWSESRWTRDKVSVKNFLLDGIWSSEYKLLKRRTQIEAKKADRDLAHPGFSVDSKQTKDKLLKDISPLISKHSAISKGIKGLSSAALGIATADVLNGGEITKKALMSMDATTISKMVSVGNNILDSNATTVAIAGSLAYIGLTVFNKGYSGGFQKMQLLYGQISSSDLRSMPAAKLGNIGSANAFRSNFE